MEEDEKNATYPTRRAGQVLATVRRRRACSNGSHDVRSSVKVGVELLRKAEGTEKTVEQSRGQRWLTRSLLQELAVFMRFHGQADDVRRAGTRVYH